MLSRRNFLIGASATVAVAAAGPAAHAIEASPLSAFSAVAIKRRWEQDHFYCVVHPQVMRDLQRKLNMTRRALLEEFRKCATPLVEVETVMIEGAAFTGKTEIVNHAGKAPLTISRPRAQLPKRRVPHCRRQTIDTISTHTKARVPGAGFRRSRRRVVINS